MLFKILIVAYVIGVIIALFLVAPAYVSVFKNSNGRLKWTDISIFSLSVIFWPIVVPISVVMYYRLLRD